MRNGKLSWVVPVMLGLSMTSVAVGWQQQPANGESASAEPASVKTESGETVSTETTESAKSIRPAPRGRLPAYFSAVVTQKQRETIYRIQARIGAEIEQLRAKIAALETARDAEVDGVLTAEQLAEVNKKRLAAERRRQERAAKSAGAQ